MNHSLAARLRADLAPPKAGATSPDDSWRLVEDDPLVRTAVERLLHRGGADELGEGGLLVGVHGLLNAARCPLLQGSLAAAAAGPVAGRPGGVVIVYVLRDPLAAELHRVHGCAAEVCVFWPATTGGRLEPAAGPGRLRQAGLTPREAQVLALLLLRRTNEEISASLVLSLSTVRAHCRAVLRKLGVRNRRDLWSHLPVGGLW
jgi:DNA-binding CsgD family transcriptional regulator